MVKRKKPAATKEKDDPVVSEHSIILLPVNKKSYLSSSFNRVQFQQTRYWLRSMKQLPTNKFLANYKQNVKQLRLGIMTDEKTNKSAIDSGLLDPTNCDVFTGDGCANYEILNYTLGFAKDNKIFLLPIDQTYDMHWKLSNNYYSAQQQQQSDNDVQTTSQESSVSALNKSIFPFALSPVRIRFARVETDAQKRRREQSALYKQKLIDQDPWVPLNVSKKELPTMFEDDISKCDKAIPIAQEKLSLKWKLRNH